MSVAYEVVGEAFVAAAPRVWSAARLMDLGTFARNFDIHPDGHRALVPGHDPDHQPRIRPVYVPDFMSELRRVVPAPSATRPFGR